MVSIEYVILFYGFFASPLALSVWLGWKFRRHQRPPPGLIIALPLYGAGVFALFETTRSRQSFMGEPPPFLSILLIAGVSIGMIFSFCWMLRRLCGVRPFLSLALAAFPVLLGLAWLNLRFCVIVHDRTGQLTDLTNGPPSMAANSRGFAGQYHRVTAVRLTRGIYCFGFPKWYRFKEKWAIGPDFDAITSPQAQGDSAVSWSRWPIRVSPRSAL